MNSEEIIEMARQAGMYQDLNVSFNQSIQNFAALVAAKEQEDIIQIIKETSFSNWFQADVIEAIRARGEQA